MDVKVDGFDLDVGEEGILVERDRVSSIVCHVEPIREKLVVNILNCLLQGDDVPFSLQFVFRWLLHFHVGVLGSSCRC